MGWMAWSWETATFFGAIAAMLALLTALAIWRPETPRRGILGFPTTRGDRFFVSFVGTVAIFLLWIRATGGNTLWYPLVAAVLFAAAMFRFA